MAEGVAEKVGSRMGRVLDSIPGTMYNAVKYPALAFAGASIANAVSSYDDAGSTLKDIRESAPGFDTYRTLNVDKIAAAGIDGILRTTTGLTSVLFGNESGLLRKDRTNTDFVDILGDSINNFGELALVGAIALPVLGAWMERKSRKKRK